MFVSNAQVDKYNAAKLERILGEEIISIATDRVRGDISQKEKELIVDKVRSYPMKDTMGLPYQLVCKVGAKYIMTVNIDTADGLVNGATGILRHLDCTDTGGNTNIAKVPIVMWLDFQMNKTGRRARTLKTKFLDSNWVPVTTCVRTFQSGRSQNIVVDRKNFPITCAEALTMHKSQGGTYTIVAVHPTKGMERASLYVGCSRCTSASGLYIVGKFMPPKRMEDDNRVKLEIDRIKEEKPLVPTYSFLTTCPDNFFQILYHNVQSLRKHYKLITNDHVFMCSDLLLFVETFTTPNVAFNLQGFYQFVTLHNYNQQRISNAGKGMACYIKNKHEPFLTILNSGYKYPLVKNIVHPEIYFMYCIFRLYNAIIIVIYKSNACPTTQLKNGITDIMRENGINLSGEKVIVFGDFNIDLLKQPNNNVSQYFVTKKINSLLENNVFTTRAATQIDWLFSNIVITNPYIYRLTLTQYQQIQFIHLSEKLM